MNRVLVPLGVVITFACLVTSAAAATKPNIVVIVGDDEYLSPIMTTQKLREFGCFQSELSQNHIGFDSGRFMPIQEY